MNFLCRIEFSAQLLLSSHPLPGNLSITFGHDQAVEGREPASTCLGDSKRYAALPQKDKSAILLKCYSTNVNLFKLSACREYPPLQLARIETLLNSHVFPGRWRNSPEGFFLHPDHKRPRHPSGSKQSESLGFLPFSAINYLPAHRSPTRLVDVRILPGPILPARGSLRPITWREKAFCRPSMLPADGIFSNPCRTTSRSHNHARLFIEGEETKNQPYTIAGNDFHAFFEANREPLRVPDNILRSFAFDGNVDITRDKGRIGSAVTSFRLSSARFWLSHYLIQVEVDKFHLNLFFSCLHFLSL